MSDLVAGQDQLITAASIRVGLGWNKERTAGFIGTGAPEVDLDASAIQFSGGQLFDLALFNNLQTRDGSVRHLGDNKTGAGDGDDETIEVDLAKVHPPVEVIVLLVTSYQGHSLEWVSRAYCRIVTDDEDGSEVELARFTITHQVKETGVVMASLVRDGDAWRLRAIGEGIAAKTPTEAIGRLSAYV